MIIRDRLEYGFDITIIGMASRSRSDEYNQHLSELRAVATQLALEEVTNDKIKVRVQDGIGELAAKNENIADGEEDQRFRAVLVLIHSNETIDFPKVFNISPQDFVNIDKILGKTDYSDIVSKGIDIAGFALTIAEKFPKIAGIASKAGGFVDFASAALTMPMIWWGTSKQNEFNGKVLGYMEAFEDLSSQFSSKIVENKSSKEWPEIKKPQPRPFNKSEPNDLNHRQLMAAKQEGIDLAFAFVMSLEKKPKKFNGKVIGGKEFLRNLSYTHGEKVGEAMKKEINKILLREKGSTYPVMKDNLIP